MSNHSFITHDQASIAARVGLYAVPKLLANAQPWLVLEQFGMKETLPKNKGKNITWRRAVPFDVSPTTLIEGVTPPATNFRYEDVSDTMDQYGRVVKITDQTMDFHEDSVLEDIGTEMGKEIQTTREIVCWNTVKNGTQVIYSGTAASRAAVEDVLLLGQIRAATNVLSVNHGEFLTKMISASQGVATEPVAPSYVGVGHRDLQGDLFDLEKFTEYQRYGNANATLSMYEVGACEGVRFQLTPHFEPFYGAGSANTTGVRSRDGDNVDVYPLVIMAKNFWGMTHLGGASNTNVTIVPPGKAVHGDELGQRGFASWKFYFCSTRLNERWGVRIETAASDHTV